MIVLAFDCATGPTSAVVWRDGEVLARCDDPRPQGQAEALVPMLADVLAQAGLAPAAVDRIGVTLGPGSFTGVRIALAAARGLSLATGAPVIGVSTLEVLNAALAPAEYPTLAVIDARRGELYAQLFAPDAMALTSPGAVALGGLPALAPSGRLRLTGSGATLAAAALGLEAMPGAVDATPDAAVLATLVARRTVRADEPPPEPIYLRAPDAKIPAAQLP